MTKFFNLTATTGADGSKALSIEIFGEIDAGFFMDGATSADIAAQLGAHPDATAINVRINSVGGDMFGGIAIYNLLKNHGARVTATIDGLAASAASIVAMAGRVVMGAGSMMMIHDPWAMVAGGAEDLRQTADVLDKARDGLVAIYQAKTGKKPGELRALLKAETWMSAAEAKAAGFADEIADKPVTAKACADGVLLNSIRFASARVPAQILAMATEAPETTPEPEPATPEAPAAEPEPPVEVPPAPAADPAPPAEAPPAEAPPADPAPDLAAQIEAARAEGHAAGVAAERARLQAIDEIAARAPAALVASAKYGAKPMSAADFAIAALKAPVDPGQAVLAARRNESVPASAISPSAPDQSRAAAERATASQIANFANRTRRAP